MNVLYRNQTEEPTTEGWFYGRNIAYGWDIEPRWVYLAFVAGVFVMEGETVYPVTEYAWFGPVPECREG